MATVERKNDESMMDIGQHCTVCRRLDFLPFTCKDCLKSYCNDHRVEYNEHECILENRKKLRNDFLKKKIDIDHLPPSKSVFPDLDKIRKEAEVNAKTRNPIGQRLSNSNANRDLSTIEVALLRLKKFVGKKSSTTGKKIFKFVNSKNSSSVGAKMVEISKLKRSAKGDSKIPVNDRVFIYCVYVPDDDSIQNNEDENKIPVFVSKNWPIGRMLDSCTDLMKIKNLNNREIAKSEKLTIFRKIRTETESKNDEIFINIPASGRVSKEIKDGDLIYIVRGANV